MTNEAATTRRVFLQAAMAGFAGAALHSAGARSTERATSLRIDEPSYGAVLNHRHGEAVDSGLKIRMSGQAPLNESVTINGIPAQRSGTRFNCDLTLRTTEDGFELPQSPDRYKGQWRDNSDWLKLAFHARANLPDRPYQNAPASQLIADLFTHKQYFWPFYSNYVANHFERLDTTIRWVTEHGYKPVFFHEGFLGGAV